MRAMKVPALALRGALTAIALSSVVLTSCQPQLSTTTAPGPYTVIGLAHAHHIAADYDRYNANTGSRADHMGASTAHKDIRLRQPEWPAGSRLQPWCCRPARQSDRHRLDDLPIGFYGDGAAAGQRDGADQARPDGCVRLAGQHLGDYELDHLLSGARATASDA